MPQKVINLFTHTDLDGVGCSILTHLYYRFRSVISVKYCSYSDIDKQLTDFMNLIILAEENNSLPSNIDRTILVTDISMSPEVAKQLDDFCSKRNFDLKLFDHHQVPEEIANYSWTNIDTSSDVCGTSLLFDYITAQSSQPIPEAFSLFVNDVRLYDTWAFDKEKETNSDNLNTLLKLVGIDQFELMITNHFILDPHIPYFVCDLENLYPAVVGENNQRKEYMAYRNQRVIKINYKGYKVGIVFAEQHISRTGDYILKRNPDLDICAIVNYPKAVSLRTLRKDINLGIDIAKPLGGGGHRQAAAYQLKSPPTDLILDLIGLKEEEHV